MQNPYHPDTIRGTTVVAIRRNGKMAMAADGQISMGDTVMKQNAKKIQKLYDGKILVGFAGAAADAMTLMERFEDKLNKNSGNLKRSAVDLAKDWRMDRVLRRLNALLIVANNSDMLVVSGTGEVIEPDDGVAAIGSGGLFALSAARALVQSTDMDAVAIARKAMDIAAQICIFTNDKIILEEL